MALKVKLTHFIERKNMYPSLILLVFSLVDDEKRRRIESVSVKRCQLLPHVPDLLSYSLDHVGPQKAVVEEEVCQKLTELPLSGSSPHVFIQLFKVLFARAVSLRPTKSYT